MSAHLETPSKPLAQDLSNIDLTKSSGLNSKLEAAPDSTPKIVMNAKDDAGKTEDPVDEKLKAVESTELEEYRTKFVGEVDLPESEEPLLKESKSRFVLFPIKYREVSLFDDFRRESTVADANPSQ